MTDKLQLYDWECVLGYACVTFLSYKTGKHKVFEIDDDVGISQRDALVDFIQGKMLVGYNSLTFDNLLTNYCIKHKNVRAADLYELTSRIINGQKNNPDFNLYKEFSNYLNSADYESIDLMRLLFSKKLRVSLKELECSLNYVSVQEFLHPFNITLDKHQKEELKEYNLVDCKATKLVLDRSMESLRLRRWVQEEYGIDTFSMDGVTLGAKILETEYYKATGDTKFTKLRTVRDFIKIKDVILPFIKFETEPFKEVLNVYKSHTWYSKDFDEELFKDNSLLYEPLIKGFKFKFSLGGAHGYTQPNVWESNSEYDIISVDVN